MIDKVIAFLIISVCATSGASAPMFGQANTDCIDFLSKHDALGDQVAVRDWLHGYFSGRVRETNRDLTIINDLNIPVYDLLHAACENNPNLNLSKAADQVYTLIP